MTKIVYHTKFRSSTLIDSWSVVACILKLTYIVSKVAAYVQLLLLNWGAKTEVFRKSSYIIIAKSVRLALFTDGKESHK